MKGRVEMMKEEKTDQMRVCMTRSWLGDVEAAVMRLFHRNRGMDQIS
jgi:hypothetical protein